MPQATLIWQRNAGSFFARGWRRERVSGQDGLDRLEELERKVRIAEEQLASTSAVLKAIPVRLRRRRQGFYGRGEIWRRPFAGVGFWAVDVGVPAVQKGLARRVDQARSGRRHGCYCSRQLVRVESEDA